MKQFHVSIDGSEHEVFTQDENDTVLRAALRAGIGFPYECNSGGCGSCKFEIVSGEVDNLWPEAPAVSDRDRRKGRLLGCQCRATSDLKIRLRPQQEAIPKIRPKSTRARLSAVHEITHDIREFRFHADETASFLPGQYAMLSLPGVASPRAYSMSNVADTNGNVEWHFQIRRVAHGAATDVLFHQLKPGDEVELDGPYGLAYLRDDVARNIVCVAGGSGLAPMISIARGASRAGLLKTCKLHFFYGARTPRDVCGESMLRELPEFGDAIKYYPVVSIPADDDMNWNGDTGFVHDAIRPKLGESLADFEFYFAGPPPMTNALHEMLMVGYRVPYQQIHFDRFF